MICLTKLFQQKRRRIGYILAFSDPTISKRDSSGLTYRIFAFLNTLTSLTSPFLTPYKQKKVELSVRTVPLSFVYIEFNSRTITTQYTY